ncbi:hypothetical protein CVT26_005387 [Gymnopilus dilepis]|uniref:Uncharacterized protein n=1 Tax=Gymnopilus dilepis TaxID=231916 RepID=A0A409WH04_9AGAR|nr:hypothetical protein CVT26_005387 [Gymnopilus dilepis]
METQFDTPFTQSQGANSNPTCGGDNKLKELFGLDFSRIIVEFQPDLKAKANRDVAERLWQGLNNEVATTGMTISGAQFTFSKNLLLTITPPVAARRFMEPDVQDRLRAYLMKALEITQTTPFWVYPDETWPRVVIHRLRIDNDVSCREAALDAIILELSSFNPVVQAVPMYMLSRAQFLTSLGKKSVLKGTNVSVCVPVRSLEDTKKLVKEGAFFKGRRHRVSVYRAK